MGRRAAKGTLGLPFNTLAIHWANTILHGFRHGDRDPFGIQVPHFENKTFDPKNNEEAMERELILAEEKRDDAQLKLAKYQQQVAKGYNRSVRTKTFKPDDLVWKKVVQASKKMKFKPNWEGPYCVVRIAGEGAYVLEDMDGKVLTNPWNAQNLRKAYM